MLRSTPGHQTASEVEFLAKQKTSPLEGGTGNKRDPTLFSVLLIIQIRVSTEHFSDQP